MPTKLLLTGASGFLGTELIDKLSSYHIIGVSRKKQTSGRVEWVTPEALSAVDFEIVLHAATAYGRNGETVEEIMGANLDFAANVLNLAIQKRARVFVNIDTTQPASTSEYANSKSQFRDILRKSGERIRIVNLELEHFYGPQAPPSNFIQWIVDSFLQDSPVIELSPCNQERDFIHIDDVVRAIVLILQKECKENALGFYSYEIGTGQSVRLRALVETLKEMTKNTKTHLWFRNPTL